MSKDQRLRCYSGGRSVSGLAHAAGYLERVVLMVCILPGLRWPYEAWQEADGCRGSISGSPPREQGSAFTLLCWTSSTGLAYAAGYLDRVLLVILFPFHTSVYVQGIARSRWLTWIGLR